MPKKHCVVIPFSCLGFFSLQVITLTRDDVTRKYCSMFSLVKCNEDYGVLAKNILYHNHNNDHSKCSSRCSIIDYKPKMYKSC